jgi:hypothetical protein
MMYHTPIFLGRGLLRLGVYKYEEHAQKISWQSDFLAVAFLAGVGSGKGYGTGVYLVTARR